MDTPTSIAKAPIITGTTGRNPPVSDAGRTLK
jgi:hypothetical protein